jgi:hypothetical protein
MGSVRGRAISRIDWSKEAADGSFFRIQIVRLMFNSGIKMEDVGQAPQRGCIVDDGWSFMLSYPISFSLLALYHAKEKRWK